MQATFNKQSTSFSAGLTITSLDLEASPEVCGDAGSDSSLRCLDNVTDYQSPLSHPLQAPSGIGGRGKTVSGLPLAFSRLGSSDRISDHGGCYGATIGEKLGGGSTVTVVAGRLYAFWQQVLVVVAGLWLLAAIAQHVFGSGQAAAVAGMAPAPAPGPLSAAQQSGVSTVRPGCKAYKYPQCEAALLHYLAHGAKNRCEAYEYVRAEGDSFQFPYSAHQQDLCDNGQAGCCGCPGQCSKCPPLLAECVSYHLDGSWKVAFGDGSRAAYTFDAHGHCEAELPTSALPFMWKPYTGAYIADGHDIPGTFWFPDIDQAEHTCAQMAGCRGITYDAAVKMHGGYVVYLKTTDVLTPAPGTSWQSLIAAQPVQLDAGAAVAGALAQTPKGFRFDLHIAAPQLFPENSHDLLYLENDELLVERKVRGHWVLNGTGVKLRSR